MQMCTLDLSWGETLRYAILLLILVCVCTMILVCVCIIMYNYIQYRVVHQKVGVHYVLKEFVFEGTIMQ